MDTHHSIPSKIICVGRSYADHATELGNAVPTEPLLFFKPASSINTSQIIDLSKITKDGALGELHFECELCVQIGNTLQNANAEDVIKNISGVTLGLDLTLRDVQNNLKAKGHPWERAKAFDNACVLGEWLDTQVIEDFTNTHFTLEINDNVRQKGDTALMLFPIAELIAHISENFTLHKGDIIMTGTPSGVGALHSGDNIMMNLQTNNGVYSWSVNVA